MLVDVKRDKPINCLAGREKEYKELLKELGDYKLFRIKRGFYITGANPDFIIENSIKDELPNFGNTFLGLRGKEENWLSCYGVCDSPEQFTDRYEKRLEEDPRNLMVSFLKIKKSEEGKKGGWRWHKWGPYIGDKHPQYEHIADEDDSIQVVYCYHVREIK